MNSENKGSFRKCLGTHHLEITTGTNQCRDTKEQLQVGQMANFSISREN